MKKLTEAELNNYRDWHEGQNSGERTFYKMSEKEVNDYWGWYEGQNSEVQS